MEIAYLKSKKLLWVSAIVAAPYSIMYLFITIRFWLDTIRKNSKEEACLRDSAGKEGQNFCSIVDDGIDLDSVPGVFSLLAFFILALLPSYILISKGMFTKKEKKTLRLGLPLCLLGLPLILLLLFTP